MEATTETHHIPNLKRLRVERLLTQKQLAERSGVSEMTVRRIENGDYGIKLLTLHKLAAGLDVPIEELAK